MKRVLEALLAISIATAGITLFKKLNILDKPGNDLKNTRKPVPTLQGIFVYLITICLIAIFHPTMLESSLIQGFLIGGTIIVAFEIIAELEYMDRIKLKVPPISRFFVQMFASVLALRIS